MNPLQTQLTRCHRASVKNPSKPTDAVRGSHARRAWASTINSSATRTAARRDRGSVLILVIVVLVLIALLGAAWLSFARTQRVAIHGVESSNIDLVMSATVAYIGEVLRDDLFNDNGELFDGTTDEYIDRPSTDETVTNFWEVSDIDGASLGFTEGGILDDTWLASTRPDFSGTPEWTQLTNLMGLYLRLPISSGSTTQPDEQLALTGRNPSSTPGWRYSADVPLSGGSTGLDNSTTQYQSLGTDADGDGILDSKWTWAPLPQQAGVRYVMAVRIIDNSALVNANVALPMGDWNTGSGTVEYANTNAVPRGWFPTDIGLSRFIAFHDEPTSQSEPVFASQLTSFVQHRMTSTTNNPVLFNTGGSTEQRLNFWLQGGRFYGQDVTSATAGTLADYIDDRLTDNDEVELRYRNGLNSATTSGIEDSATGMPFLLRAEDSGGTALPEETTYTTNFTDEEDFFTSNPRLMLTVRSGSNIYAPRLPGETGTDNAVPVRTDLNGELGNVRATLDSAIDDLGVANVSPPGTSINNVDALADVMTANVRDYMDADNVLTEIDSRFGLEPLPFISEFYTQGHYEVTNVGVDTTPPTPDEDVATFTLQDPIRWTVEIRNPFNVPVDLRTVRLMIPDSSGDPQPLGGGAIAGIGTPVVPDFLQPDQVLLLRYNPTGQPNISGPETCDGSNNYTHAVVDVTGEANGELPRAAAASAYTPVALTIEMRCQTSTYIGPIASPPPGTDADWPYQTFRAETFPVSYEVRSEVGIPSPAADDFTVGDAFVTQSTYVSNANRINLMTIDGDEVQTGGYTSKGQPASLAGPNITTIDETNDALGFALKSTSNGGPLPDANVPAEKVDPRRNQVIFSTDADLQYRFAWELAQIAFLNLDGTERIAQAWSTATQVNDFYLQLGLPGESGSVSAAGSDGNAVPHGLLLLERFTTLSPQADGVDNDGDGSEDEADELFVPGTINLNTVTFEVLQRILPLPDEKADMTKMAQAVLRYRDRHEVADSSATVDRDADAQAISVISGYRTTAKGIAHLGELLYVLNSSQAGDFLEAESISSDDEDSFAMRYNATDSAPIDFLTGSSTGNAFPNRTDFEIPDALDQATPPSGWDTGIIDDREEQITYMKRLAQVASVRSDVFTAYITIRGYPADDFRDGPVESAQFLAVFSRAGLTSANDEVQLIGYYVLSKN